jgi:bifunctional NMN adenylyltransferase/nudix hydrolase
MTSAVSTKPTTASAVNTHDSIVYIGRFQPFHNAHMATILRALELAPKVVIVIGSANQPRDEENPFTQEERENVIRKALIDHAGDVELVRRVSFVAVENNIYSNAGWALDVITQVEPHLTGEKVGIIGHNKDESSFYLTMFPQWETIDQPLVEILDATTIRNLYFSPKRNTKFFKAVVPESVVEFLENFHTKPEYQDIVESAEYIAKYKKQFEHLPYPISFNTGDAIVFKSNHVLMIRRKANPGKGLLAFPGGFLNALDKVNGKGKLIKADASLLACAIRELYEETKIDLPEAMIVGSIVEEKIFDAVKRSRRGRVITTAQIIVLPEDGRGLPKVKGSDDALEALWVPIHKLTRIMCFEDHYDMLKYAIAVYQKNQKTK